MKLSKNLLIGTAITLGSILTLSAQNKSSNNLDAQMPRWFVGAGVFGGIQSSSISQNNWTDTYLNPLNANVNKVAQEGGYNLGLNLNLAYYLGKSRNFGIGTGIQYLHQNTKLGLNPMSIEYQSTDNFGSVFRQGVRSSNTIKEQLKQNIIGIPVMLLFKKQLNQRWGLNLDAGMVFNIVNTASFNADNAKFDYEAIYKLDNNGVPIYDNSSVPDPNSWLITKAHYERVNTDGNVNTYFENLHNQGYNVGLNIEPSTKSGDVKNTSIASSWFIRPSVSYRIKPNLALHANIAYQQIKTSFQTQSNYMITNKRGSYETMTSGLQSNTQGLISFGIGLRYYFGKERIKEEKKPTLAPAPAPKPVVKEDPYKEMVKVMVKLQDEKYGKPVEGNIVIKQGNKTVYNGKADQSGISNFYLEPGNYTVGVSAKGYIPAEESLELQTNEKGKSKTIELKQPKIEKGLVFKLKAINFETGSNKLTQTSFDLLDKMADILIENPNMVVEVAGHTDNVGDDQKNLELSQKRAEEVMNYLLAKGAKAKQMKAIGYGETKPVADNETPEGRLQNRRVMFTVLDF